MFGTTSSRRRRNSAFRRNEEDIRVNMTNGSVEIGLDYSVPIDLKFYQFTLQFHPHADNHSI